MNFDVLNGVEGVEICCLYEFVKQFFRCLDVIHSINVENANEVGFKTGLPMGGLNLYRLDLKPKKAPLGYHVRWGTRHQKPFGNNIETESHMFKRKIVLKDVSKDALLFLHVFFFFGGGLGRCVTWDGLLPMSGSGPEWCKLPEDLVKYLETGTFLGAMYRFFFVAGRVQMFRDIWWFYKLYGVI